MKVQILADYINSIKSELKPSDKKCFIVLCTLDAVDNLQDEWMGSLNNIKTTINKSEQRIMKDSQQKFNQVIEYVENVAVQEKKAIASLSQGLSSFN